MIFLSNNVHLYPINVCLNVYLFYTLIKILHFDCRQTALVACMSLHLISPFPYLATDAAIFSSKYVQLFVYVIMAINLFKRVY